MARDEKKIFKFVSLQSDEGQSLLKKFGLNSNEFDSIVLIDGEKYFTRSTAALKIVKEFKGLWKLLYILILIPSPIRNFFYDIIAKNRYKWFGKKDLCRMNSGNDNRKYV